MVELLTAVADAAPDRIIEIPSIRPRNKNNFKPILGVKIYSPHK
jgi:hypothetical protein